MNRNLLIRTGLIWLVVDSTDMYRDVCKPLKDSTVQCTTIKVLFGLFRTRLTCIRLFKQVNCTVGSVGNSLIGFSSDLLVFCVRKNKERFAREKRDLLVKRGNCSWKRANRSRCSFVMSDLSESLTVAYFTVCRITSHFQSSPVLIFLFLVKDSHLTLLGLFWPD